MKSFSNCDRMSEQNWLLQKMKVQKICDRQIKSIGILGNKIQFQIYFKLHRKREKASF